MRRTLSIAALSVLLCLPVCAQMRGGTRVGGGLPAAGMRATGRPTRVHGAFGNGFNRSGFGRPGAFPFHHHHRFFGAALFGYPWVYAYYPGYWDYSMDYSDYDRSDIEQQQLQSYQAQMMNDQQRIEQRINELEERLDRLYEQKSAPAVQSQAQPQRQSRSDTPHTAVLVYKDGRTQEVENYAIVGHTIWLLNEQQAKKVPLSSLDLKATRKANQDRDVDLPLPPSNS